MKVKVVLSGEAVNIPYTDIGLGVALIRVWVDGNGFTSASNDLAVSAIFCLRLRKSISEVLMPNVNASSPACTGRLSTGTSNRISSSRTAELRISPWPYQCSRTAGSSRRRSNSSLQTARAWPSSAMPSISPARCSRSRRRSLSSTATRSCPMTSSLLPLTQRRRPLLRAKPLSELAELPPVPVQQANPESATVLWILMSQ